MPHTHRGGLSHEHARGDVTHEHDDVTTRERVAYSGDPADRRVDHEVHPAGYGYGVRGGFSFGSILTGVAVALGAMLLLVAAIGGIVAALGADGGVTGDDVTQFGWGAAIGLILAQLLAYLWGGYTAGRMARGLGWLNGLMVPVMAIVLALLVGVIVQSSTDAAFDVPFGATRVPVGIDLEQLREVGLLAGIGSLIAMFIGGIFGGMLGARWHDKLEARRVEEEPHLRAA
jgi:hypothetical protein